MHINYYQSDFNLYVENCSSKKPLSILTSLKCNEISCCNKLSVEKLNCLIFCICICIRHLSILYTNMEVHVHNASAKYMVLRCHPCTKSEPLFCFNDNFKLLYCDIILH